MRVRVEQFEKRSGLKCWENPTPNAPPRKPRILGIEREGSALVGRNNAAHWFEDPVLGHSVSRAEAWQRFNANHGPSEQTAPRDHADFEPFEMPAREPPRFTALERFFARILG